MSLVMNYYSLNSLVFSSSSHRTIPLFIPQKWGISWSTSSVSFALRRHHRRRRTTHRSNQPKVSPPPDQNLQMVIDIENLSNEASLSVRRLLRSTQLRFSQFVQSGNEALEDLQTLITFDADRKVLVSCRRSTVQFVGSLVLWSCVVLFAFRILVKFSLRIWDRLAYGKTREVIWRRDRSLGGREVVVGRKSNASGNLRVPKSPLSPARETVLGASATASKNWARAKEEKLPSWWPVLLPPPVMTVDNQEYQRMANRLIRAILDCRINGRDISEIDIIQFRRLCRTSGARVFIDTANARDSFYRVAVNLVLNICSRVGDQVTSVCIDGEDAQQFLVGLADNIGLEHTQAARMVSAAVAARTRSCFLQAWALEMQGKRSEALLELSKLCYIHQIFPPEGNSPEMEMVARGLVKHLKVEQRLLLMDMFSRVCSEGSHRSIAEALGLEHSPDGVTNEHTNKL